MRNIEKISILDYGVIDMNAKKYTKTKLMISVIEAGIIFTLILLFVITGLSLYLEKLLSNYFEDQYLLLISFVSVAIVFVSIFILPLTFYSDYIIEHKYKLSNQTISKYFTESLKEILVTSLIGLPILLMFYYVLNQFQQLWYIPFAIFMFFISVVLGQIFPIFIFPLFYKVTPLEDEELQNRIRNLTIGTKLKIENVFKFNMSKNTRKANAAFTGLGKSKRILLGDTFIENYSPDEIETVLAHEFGHFQQKHIVKNILIGTTFSFVSLFLIAQLYNASIYWLGFVSLTKISALPLLLLWGMVISLIFQPASNYLSRKYEYEADAYSVKITNKKEVFINALEKLNEQNLGDKEPHPFVEWFFYSHPSIKKRIDAIKNSV